MARLKHPDLQNLMKEHLEADEHLIAVAYGVKQPPMLLLILLIALAVLPGMIIVHFMTKHYFVAITNKRIFVLQTKGFRAIVKGQFQYSYDQVRGIVKTSTGAIFTHIKINDPNNKFVAKFHRGATKENRDQAMMIAAALENGMPPQPINNVPPPPLAPTNEHAPEPSKSTGGPNIKEL
jgi:hypothetical protein